MAFWNRTRPTRERVEPTIKASSDTPLVGMSELTGGESWMFGGAGQSFGPVVTEQTAMAVSTVFRCVSLLSGLMAALPLKVYRDDPVLGRVEATEHRLAKLLSVAPYPGRPYTAFDWREMWGHHFLLSGNHFSAIRYDQAARVVGFEPIHWWLVEVFRLPTRRLVYRFNWPDRPAETLDQDDVLHIKGPGFDGIRSPSRIQVFARHAVALAKVLEEGTGIAHENGAKPSGMVTLPPNVTREEKDRIEAYHAERTTGRRNRGKVLFVDKDTTFTQMQMTPEDLATIGARRFTTEDLCRFWGVPPHLVGESATTTAWGTGVEQNTLGFLRFTLNPDLIRAESEINMKLLAGTSYYVMFDRDALVGMDAKTAAEVANLRIGSAQLTPNEARRRQHLPIIEGGDEPLVNSTMIPLKRALNPPEAPANVKV